MVHARGRELLLVKVHGCLPIPGIRRRSNKLTFSITINYKTIIMKKLLISITMILMMLSLSSCAGFIDAIVGSEDNPVEAANTTTSTEEVPAPATQYEPSTLLSENDLKQAIAAIYKSAALFEANQITLEAFRLKKIDNDAFGSTTINLENEILYNAWKYAYNVVARANSLINALANIQDYQTAPYLAEIIALRSFAYYQLTLLWGDVPLITEESDPLTMYGRTDKSEVLTYVYNKLDGVKDKFSTTNDASHFNVQSAQSLLAEISLALSKKNDAKTILSGIKDQAAEDIFHFLYSTDDLTVIPTAFASMLSSSSDYSIYGKNYLGLLYKEAADDTEGLSDTWYSSSYIYGMWTALKRLGAAKEKTGCEDHELLMPIPLSELHLNPMITQNPGY